MNFTGNNYGKYFPLMGKSFPYIGKDLPMLSIGYKYYIRSWLNNFSGDMMCFGSTGDMYLSLISYVIMFQVVA